MYCRIILSIEELAEWTGVEYWIPDMSLRTILYKVWSRAGPRHVEALVRGQSSIYKMTKRPTALQYGDLMSQGSVHS